MPAASVVIPCRGHSGTLARCLASVTVQEATDFEIIVVDAAHDDAVVATATCFPTVRIVRSNRPLLPGDARNLGVRSAQGTVILFIDADCTADPGWLAAGLAGLNNAVIVGGTVEDGAPWHPIAVIDNVMQFAHVPPARPAGPIASVPACNMAIRRADFERLGGFPTIILPAGEDGLFCARAAERWPGELWFEPEMRVRHFGRTTLRSLADHQHRFGHARAMLGLALTPAHRRLGRHAALAPAVALVRLAYLMRCGARWRPFALTKMLLFSPILVFAMAAWCRGFRAGCRQWAAAGSIV